MASIDTRLSGFNNVALLIGRILIGVLFLIASYNKFKGLGRRLFHQARRAVAVDRRAGYRGV